MPKVVQTAGRDALGTFAPQFAALNDDVLFGEVWSNDDLTLKMRSILTVTTLVAKGMADTSFEHHVANAKKNGSRPARWPPSSPMWPSTPAGPTPGPPSAWC